MKGCVRKDDKGGYFLLLQKGTKVKLNSAGDVAAHEGQQVKISGAFIDAQEPGDPAQSDSKAHAVREFRVIKVDVLASTCTAPPSKKKK